MASTPLPDPNELLAEPLLPKYHYSHETDLRGQPLVGPSTTLAAELKRQTHGFSTLSLPAKCFWLLLAIISQCAWGLYGVFCRYLQVESDFPPFFLTFMVTALAVASLLLLVTVPVALVKCGQACFRRKQYRRDEDVFQPPLMACARYGLGCGLAYFILTVTQICGYQLTQAYFVQLVFIALPIFVAILNKIFFRQVAPKGLWSSVMLVIIGVGLVVYGGFRGADSEGLTSKDGVGFIMSAIAVCSLAVFLILAQQSHGYLHFDQVLWSAFLTQLVVSLGLSVWTGQMAWDVLQNLKWKWDWIFLLAAGVGVTFGANMMQQLVIRKVGAPLMSMFMPLNLVAATAGSYLILNEPIRDDYEAGGLLLVALSIFWFLLVQWQIKG